MTVSGSKIPPIFWVEILELLRKIKKKFESEEIKLEGGNLTP